MATPDHGQSGKGFLLRMLRLIVPCAAILAGCLYTMDLYVDTAFSRDSETISDQSTGQVIGCEITGSRVTVNGVQYVNDATTAQRVIVLTSTEDGGTTITNTRTKSQVAHFAPGTEITVSRPGKCEGVNGITG